MLAPALGAALRLGSAHRPTATRAFDAVVTWRDDLRDEFFTEDVLEKVLPGNREVRRGRSFPRY